MNEPQQWVVVSNMPGYMPDSEPATFETRGEAVMYLVEEINHDCDNACDCDDIDIAALETEASEAIDELADGADLVYFNNQAYWLGIAENEVSA